MSREINSMPLFGNPNQQHCFAVRQQQAIKQAQFWQDVATLQQQLPDCQYLINSCEDRYLFCVGLLSAALRDQITLLPASRSPGIIDELQDNYGSLALLLDRNLYQDALQQDIPQLRLDQLLLESNSQVPLDIQTSIDAQQIVAIAFTSGSTGQPKPHRKTWGNLVTCAELALQRLDLADKQYAMLSTTPAQHMFGLETSVIWPLQSQLTLVAERPFYPEDIRRAIAAAEYPVVLCSTPAHLRACVENTQEWTNLKAVICSTAALPVELAQQVEQVLNTELVELYGSTETLSYASRRTALENDWQPYAGVSIIKADEDKELAILNAPFLDVPVQLDDLLQISNTGRFKVLGRHSDIIKIAGKRTSITELNQRLLMIRGIQDGSFYLQQRHSAEHRLGIVVISELSREQICSQLRKYLDEVFIPRKVLYTRELPRNATGKLQHHQFEQLIKELSS